MKWLSRNDLTALVAETAALQRDLAASAPDPRQTSALLRTLQAIARFSVGTVPVRWPKHPQPLFLSGGITAHSNFVQIFLGKEDDVSLPYAPARILDLGGYVCYAAAYLAAKLGDAGDANGGWGANQSPGDRTWHQPSFF